MDKKELAQTKIELRANLNIKQKQEYDHLIRQNILDVLDPYRSVALFASFNHEIDTFVLIEKLLKKEYRIFLPKVEGKIMNFIEIESQNDLIKSSMGIMEPKAGTKTSKEEIEVIVIPLLAYNSKKQRIGYGGGYYDRYLKDYTGLKLGIGYTFQFTEVDFAESFDVACDYIVTERGVE